MKQPHQSSSFARLAEVANRGKPEQQAPQVAASVAIPSVDLDPAATAKAIHAAAAKRRGTLVETPSDPVAAAIVAAGKKRRNES